MRSAEAGVRPPTYLPNRSKRLRPMLPAKRHRTINAKALRKRSTDREGLSNKKGQALLWLSRRARPPRSGPCFPSYQDGITAELRRPKASNASQCSDETLPLAMAETVTLLVALSEWLCRLPLQHNLSKRLCPMPRAKRQQTFLLQALRRR